MPSIPAFRTASEITSEISSLYQHLNLHIRWGLTITIVPVHEQGSHWTQAATKLHAEWAKYITHRYLTTPNSQATVTTRKMHCKNAVGGAKQILYRLQNTVHILQKLSLYRQEQILKQWKRHAGILSSHVSQEKNHQILSYSEKIQTHLTSYSMTIAISSGCFPHHLGHISAGGFQPMYVCQQHMDPAN